MVPSNAVESKFSGAETYQQKPAIFFRKPDPSVRQLKSIDGRCAWQFESYRLLEYKRSQLKKSGYPQRTWEEIQSNLWKKRNQPLDQKTSVPSTSPIAIKSEITS